MDSNIVTKISVNSCEPKKKITIIENPDAPEGKTILVAIDFFSNENSFGIKKTPWGKEIELYGISESGFTFINNLVKEKELKSLILYSLVPYSTLEASTGLKKSRYEESFAILDKFLNKKPVDGILFSGYYGLNSEYESKFQANKFGRIGKYKNIPCIYTLSLNQLCMDKKGENQEDNASLLDFFINHLDILIEGKDRYTIDKNGWESILVKDIQTFKSMMNEIESSKITCYDTETTGLSRTQETLLTIQIAVSPKKAYILPWQHKQSPWTEKELNYIKARFKKYFERGISKFHIYQNAKYDLSQFFSHLNLKYYNHRIYDLMAGEFCLCENRKFLSNMGILGPYTLEFIAKNYGAGDIFKEGKLGKKDRTVLADEDLVDIAEYGAKDVILPYQIAKFQLQEAKRRGDKGFLKLVIDQLSAMIYCFTIMEFNGSLIDKAYLLDLRDKNSILGKKFKEVEEKFKTLDSVKKANDILLEESGYSSKNTLFGIKKWLFDINREDSQQKLFYDVLGLKPLEIKKNGKGALGKDFKDVYKDVLEVALLNDHDKIKKVKTTFIDAHFDRFKTDKDLAADSRLRSSYQFTGVVTGRASACVTLDCLTNISGNLLNGKEALQKYNPYLEEVRNLNTRIDTSIGMQNSQFIMYHKSRNVLRFKTKLGYNVGTDESTPILVLTSTFELTWKKAKEIQLGDLLCISCYNQTNKEEPEIDSLDEVLERKSKRNYNMVFPKRMSPSLAKVLGYLCSEGSGLKFIVTDKEIFDDFIQSWKETFGVELKPIIGKSKNKTTYGVDFGGSNKLKLFFARLGYNCENCWNKTVPHILFKSSAESIKSFIRAYIEGDGYLIKRMVSIYSTSEQMILGIQQLLLRLGIFSIKRNPKNLEKLKENCHPCYCLCITGENFLKFQSEFRYIGFKKFTPFELGKNNNSVGSSIPYILNFVDSKIIKHLDGGSFVKNGGLSKQKITDSFLWQLKQKQNNLYRVLIYLLKHNIYTSEVINIATSIEDVYDFTMKTQQNHMKASKLCKQSTPIQLREGHYLANGIIVHNSNPNLQQIPSRGEYCSMVRRQFIAPSNCLLMHLDYSAHEVRNWGNVAKDEMVCNAFDQGKQLRKQVRYYFSTDLDIWKKFREFQKETKWICKDKDQQLTYEQKVDLINNIEDKKFKKLCQLCLDLENKGDVHKLNYEFFFGVPAYLVNKQQRQSVKSVVFGVIYGKGAITLAEDIHGTEEEAQHIMNMLFEKFENGGNWIRKVQADGKKTYQVKSPLGRIRHLCAYRHPGFSVQSSMDRKGPNSCIQGFASDIGFMAGKILQDLCWNWFWKRGIDFQFIYQNVVHDSTEDCCRIRHIPIAMYMAEHAYTTLVHRKLRDIYGFELTCGYEVEADVGGSLCEMYTIENFCELERYVKESIEWSKENLTDWVIEEGEYEAFLHNLKIIDKYRKQELKESYGKKVDYDMLLNEDNILEIGLIL